MTGRTKPHHNAAHRGSRNFHTGHIAEDVVAKWYTALGARLETTRRRGQAGEVDLVMRDGDTLIFIEVKASRTHARAAQRISAQQKARLFSAAEEYAGRFGAGTLQELRFDAALVDQNGHIEVIENAFAV